MMKFGSKCIQHHRDFSHGYFYSQDQISWVFLPILFSLTMKNFIQLVYINVIDTFDWF